MKNVPLPSQGAQYYPDQIIYKHWKKTITQYFENSMKSPSA